MNGPAGSKVSCVARDQCVRVACNRHFQKRQVVRIRKLDREWMWHDAFGHRLERREDAAQLSGFERDLRPMRNRAVLGENSIVCQ